MGKREQRKWDLLLGEGSVLLLLCVLFFAGGVLGCFFAGVADHEGTLGLQAYVTDYLRLAQDGAVNREFLGCVWSQLRDILLVFLLSVTAIGVIGIPAILCMRGFLLAFSVGCFCRVFGAVGLLPAVVLFGIPALLWGPALFLASFQGMEYVQEVLRKGNGERRGESQRVSAFWMRAGICGALLLACAGAECTVIPILLQGAARIVL